MNSDSDLLSLMASFRTPSTGSIHCACPSSWSPSANIGFLSLHCIASCYFMDVGSGLGKSIPLGFTKGAQNHHLKGVPRNLCHQLRHPLSGPGSQRLRSWYFWRDLPQLGSQALEYAHFLQGLAHRKRKASIILKELPRSQLSQLIAAAISGSTCLPHQGNERE